ncbi:hypothetical protein L8C07_12415 [Paenibacillus sp. CMAA1739]|uniref:hypothetical protein n=1 Tax=Paenibacillus ottowii TaxID=2315729 RepID=UPI002DBEF740|nr:hypothetical protein [Paenibacillus sp. CMAA1739]MEC4566751.1 hypothetical protein [Paenibacillus sp. CMAA1739]
MTDKQRLIDADKLIKQLQDNRDLFAEDKFGSPSYNMGRVDSYHTMITWINNGHFDPDPPQQPDIQREYERFQQVAKGWNDDLTKAEAEIEQKDAEIAKIKNMLLDAIGSLTMYGNDACEEQARRIARDLRKLTHVQPEHTSGDTP